MKILCKPFLLMTYLYHSAYSGGQRCEYGGGWYKGVCSCASHRRDRQYYDPKSFTKRGPILSPRGSMTRSPSCEILEIEPPLSPEIIRTAYKKMSLKTHPDKGGSNEMFIKVANAYRELLLLC
tara:strand:+ start:1508 stop:1876 length:369 start_codon:yes stop_codon:yes gene_type:complete